MTSWARWLIAHDGLRAMLRGDRRGRKAVHSSGPTSQRAAGSRRILLGSGARLGVACASPRRLPVTNTTKNLFFLLSAAPMGMAGCGVDLDPFDTSLTTLTTETGSSGDGDGDGGTNSMSGDGDGDTGDG